jgi:myo-inositol catabolism protein IolC
MYGFPHLPEVGLAVVVAHMRQDIDRRIAEKFDIVGAAGRRPLDISGRKHIEKIQDALAVKVLDHFFSVGVGPDWPADCRFHCEPNCAAFNRQKMPRAEMLKQLFVAARFK